ncbi:MAG TPA: NADP-dependent malic enzyme [Bacteroidetes bacterium]|nr:NADP-dependent malic enzyme [Ignavibacteriaceae bacterium]HAY32555.1 NADP-dependent malic enzyme [Bacteroidota bacterium]HRI46875.1 NADP-dependent malic enzyme [Ignavibacteriaceae bacterium]
MKISKDEALEYHKQGRKGKIEVIPSKPCLTQRDLSLAYTPGVADPCLEIEKDPSLAYEYTAKGNLVAVISNGTAVLGLGNIGALAGKPVMEGKGVLFKRFADIDVFDIELNTEDSNEIIRTCQILEPTFGGINLEDIKAPECFYIEEELKRTMNIPVFHDDQHGTAIISGAALINACHLANKKLEEIVIVFSGAGASAIACANLYLLLGVKRENILMCDSSGVIYKGRPKNMNEFKEKYAVETDKRTIEDALKGANVFVGLSSGGKVSQDAIRSMAPNAIVFALANPNPEISYDDAKAARKDIIIATGRSDFPNQVNNVLGFPFIFRGALDVRASQINDEMKLAASHALAELAKEEVPDAVKRAYGGQDLTFGPEYIIPKPFDPRVLTSVAPAVAKAAMETKVARKEITDWDAYKEELLEHLGISREVVRRTVEKAKGHPRKIVFPEGEQYKILKAAQQLIEDNIAEPILLGNIDVIQKQIEDHHINAEGMTFIDPTKDLKFQSYVDEFYKIRQRRGVSKSEAKHLISQNNYFGSMMVRLGDADGLISGLTSFYPETIRPALQIVELAEGVKRVSGMYMVHINKKVYFFADTTVNVDPTAEELVEIAHLSAQTVKRFSMIPKIALLSFSNFGSAPYPQSIKVRKATEMIKSKYPDLMVDGEMQADTAIAPDIINEYFPFSDLKGRANVLVFPDLNSGNIAYKLLWRMANADVIGPILMGMSKPVHVLQKGADINDIVNMAAIAVVEANEKL